MSKAKSILVCGAGAVGERHIRNLITLGYEQIAVYRARGLPFRTLDRDLPVYTDLSRALIDFAPGVVFVTNPTALHLPIALQAAQAGCHLFIEKPVSHSLDGLDKLQSVLETSGCFAMVGYMLRFHPLFKQVKEWLDEGPEGTLGRPLFARSTWGEHLPDWHPWEDYRQSYAAQPDMGGGPALTLSHDIDLLVWLFGHARYIVGLSATQTPLEIEAEHAIDLLVRFESGTTANLHLDYCQRPPRRQWELVCTHGRVEIDYYAGNLIHWSGIIGEPPPMEGPHRPSTRLIQVPSGFDRNDLFVAELRYFFECIDSGVPPAPGVAEAAESVRIALAALEEQPR